MASADPRLASIDWRSFRIGITMVMKGKLGVDGLVTAFSGVLISPSTSLRTSPRTPTGCSRTASSSGKASASPSAGCRRRRRIRKQAESMASEQDKKDARELTYKMDAIADPASDIGAP